MLLRKTYLVANVFQDQNAHCLPSLHTLFKYKIENILNSLQNNKHNFYPAIVFEILFYPPYLFFPLLGYIKNELCLSI